ncbi:hypothetical protein ALQ35_02911 [Pseudomonas fluorescens]|nr:hypothetical protein ALQ35_02911 [Pseudomonas fluorescens]
MSDNPVNTNSPGRPKDMAKRQAILEAAKILFLSNGYASTSMDAVALEAGVSKLTVYSHFTDKETLFTAAVVAKCEEQLPVMYFELPEDIPVQTVLLNIARGFHRLINSEESVNLHRLMMTTGNQDVKLSQIFFEAGPMRMLQGMERLLSRIDQSGALSIDKPLTAACSRARRTSACCMAAAGHWMKKPPKPMCRKWWGCSCGLIGPEALRRPHRRYRRQASSHR